MIKKWKYMIWSSFPDFAEWEDDLREQYPERSQTELLTLMYETNNDYLDTEREILDIRTPNDILVIADLGLWNGRVNAYKVIGGNVRNCLVSSYDPEWYIDERGDLCCDDHHHDGCNYYIYRLIKKGTTERQLNNLKQKILTGTATRRDITRITTRLGDIISSVYDWKAVMYAERHESKMVRSKELTDEPATEKQFRMA